jgi:hypothetical protein
LQRGLFERHKLLFALMLTNKILVSSGKVKTADVDVLLKGGGALDIASVSCVGPVLLTASPSATAVSSYNCLVARQLPTDQTVVNSQPCDYWTPAGAQEAQGVDP